MNDQVIWEKACEKVGIESKECSLCITGEITHKQHWKYPPIGDPAALLVMLEWYAHKATEQQWATLQRQATFFPKEPWSIKIASAVVVLLGDKT